MLEIRISKFVRSAMPLIYMIRHGRAAAGWDADMDPGLDDLGRSQSEAVARDIEKRSGVKLPLVSSPLTAEQADASRTGVLQFPVPL